MANQLQLQRQIQEEIDREAKIDRKIESMVKKFLRYYYFNPLPRVQSLVLTLLYSIITLTHYHVYNPLF